MWHLLSVGIFEGRQGGRMIAGCGSPFAGSWCQRVH